MISDGSYDPKIINNSLIIIVQEVGMRLAVKSTHTRLGTLHYEIIK